MKYILLLLLFPLFIIAQTPAERESYKNRDKYLFAARPVQKNFLKTIPFDFENIGQIIVPVTIKGKTYHFLFDTGATTLVSKEIVSEFALTSLFKNNIKDGAGNVQDETFYDLPGVNVSGIDFKNVTVAAVDMKKFETLFCVKLDGILGTNIMRSCFWKIDYTKGLITFSDKEIKPGKNMQAIDFVEGFSGTPILKIFIGIYNVSMHMDTGYNGGLFIPDSLYFKSRENRNWNYKKGYGTTAMTLFENEFNEKYTGLLDSIYMGNKQHLILNAIADIDHSDAYLVGNGVFSGFGELVLDWKKHRLYLPDTVINLTDRYTTSGFAPAFKDGALIVSIVWEGSDAFAKGLEAGDVITAINGQNTVGMQQEDWCDLLEVIINKKIAQVSLALRKKDGSVLECTLTPSALLD